ncbi:MAG: metal ABC transporter permease [Actinomycetota bacterium]
MSFLGYDFMQRALIAGALVGLAAPAIGIFIVQRRLSLMGDGIGHVAFAGIAAGLLVGISPLIVAIVFASAGAIIIELLRERDRTSGDLALALVFYGGIALAVLFVSLSDTSTLSLNAYLFGSVVSVSTSDLLLVVVVSIVVIVFATVLRNHLFSIAYDEEAARVAGLPVRALNLSNAVVTAVTVAMASRVVGILLVSSMLVLPVAAAQQLSRSFRGTVYGSLLLGLALSTCGLIVAFYADVAPSAAIVLGALAVFFAASVLHRISGGRIGT